ncbi:hypothetical protein LTR95_000632 [Oleoguttula sp. CCFEE 5521]
MAHYSLTGLQKPPIGRQCRPRSLRPSSTVKEVLTTTRASCAMGAGFIDSERQHGATGSRLTGHRVQQGTREMDPACFDNRYTRPTYFYTGGREDPSRVAISPGDIARIRALHPLPSPTRLSRSATNDTGGPAFPPVKVSLGKDIAFTTVHPAPAYVPIVNDSSESRDLLKSYDSQKAFSGVREKAGGRLCLSFKDVPPAFMSTGTFGRTR